MITSLLPKLQGHLPDNIYTQLPSILSFGIDGPYRLSHLLGQSAEESENFTVFTENLNYSGEALWSLFHTHFTSAQEAMTYARQPERIANRIYANRLGNSDEASGDGWLHKGEGAIQLTGADNQGDFFESVDLPRNSDPHLIATQYSLISAAWFFRERGIWPICDHGIDIPTITTVTHHVNGGELGLRQRIAYTQQFYYLLTT